MPTSREAWERVLAAIEADTARTEALLRASEELAATDAAGAAERPADGGPLPAEWLLPATVELPPLDTMPAVPGELSDRILSLRSQILALQAELAAAMQSLPRPPRATLAPVPAQVPAFIDRRL